MSLSSKEYFLKETYKSVRRNGFMSIASMSTVAVSLLILGIFLLLSLNTNHLAEHLESQVEISVYMQDDADAETLAQTQQALAAMPGVTHVEAISKEAALERFRERLGEQAHLLDSLGEDNPFPASFALQVDKPDRIEELETAINALAGVETAKFGQEVVEHLFQLTRILRLGGALLVFFLALATLFIIANTIRLTVFARRREVNIMKYVGATDWFIRWPFILEGMTLGFFGALLAALLLYLVYGALLTRIHATLAFLPLLPADPLLTYLCIFLVFAGIGIGALGSYISLRRFLRV